MEERQGFESRIAYNHGQLAKAGGDRTDFLYQVEC